MALIYNRYAEAFFKLSLQENKLDKYKSELLAVNEIFMAENDFRNFMLSPKHPMNYKKQVLKDIFGGRISKDTFKFMMILLERRRLKFLSEICTEFVKLSDENQNILSITVVTAMPLDQKQLKSISEKFKKFYDSSYVKITEKIDASLIGGVKVIVDDKLFDASLKEKLFGMRSAITLKHN